MEAIVAKQRVPKWQNLLGWDHWVQAGPPCPKAVEFRDLVGVAIAPVSKKLTVIQVSM